MIIFISILIVLLSLFAYYIIFVEKEILPGILIIFFTIIMIFALYCIEIYGIRIKNDKLRIVSQSRVRFTKIENVKSFHVEFIKNNYLYDCYATLELNNGKIVKFTWDKVRSNKVGSMEFDINDVNVFEFQALLSEYEFITCEIK